MQKEIKLEQREIEEKFIRGTGPGGQKINKTSSTVFLRDVQTGLSVKVQASREQSRNRKIARQLLQLKIDSMLHPHDGVEALKRQREQRRKARHLRRLTVGEPGLATATMAAHPRDPSASPASPATAPASNQ
jgi:protein subunit release factor B